MVIIPNSRFQQETEQTETVKQSEEAAKNRPSIDAEKSEELKRKLIQIEREIKAAGK